MSRRCHHKFSKKRVDDADGACDHTGAVKVFDGQPGACWTDGAGHRIIHMVEFKKLRIAFALLASTIVFGTTGYMVVEGMSPFDSLYQTIITISTVGYQEVKPLSTAGRVVTMVLISTGITVGAYTIGTVLRLFIEGEFQRTFGRRKVEKRIAGLKNHYIICGFGRIGSLVCREFRENNLPFVVIDRDPAAVRDLEGENFLFLQLDATSEEALEAAGIARAKGLITAVRSDADNVFITLTAKGIRPDIFVLARASDEKSESKLKRAGATRVVSPYLIGGRRMAQVILKPTVIEFIDIAMMAKNLGLVMEEARVRDGSDLAGKNLIESNLRRDFGVIIVAIQKHGGEMIFNPTPEVRLEENDVIVVLGQKTDVTRMNKIL